MGILMRLTNERGYPWGTCPINTILILTFRTDLAGQVGLDEIIQRFFAELTVADKQMRQAPRLPLPWC
jgi:hypothetical protein